MAHKPDKIRIKEQIKKINTYRTIAEFKPSDKIISLGGTRGVIIETIYRSLKGRKIIVGVKCEIEGHSKTFSTIGVDLPIIWRLEE